MNTISINFLSSRSCPATQTKVKLSIWCNGVTVRSQRNGLVYIILRPRKNTKKNPESQYFNFDPKEELLKTFRITSCIP